MKLLIVMVHFKCWSNSMEITASSDSELRTLLDFLPPGTATGPCLNLLVL